MKSSRVSCLPLIYLKWGDNIYTYIYRLYPVLESAKPVCNVERGAVYYITMILRARGVIHGLSTPSTALTIARILATRPNMIKTWPTVKRRAFSATRSIRKVSEATVQRKKDDSSSYKGQLAATCRCVKLISRPHNALPTLGRHRSTQAGLPPANHHSEITALMDRLENI
jgi:hypothetical protein